jgi:hypothetical protein
MKVQRDPSAFLPKPVNAAEPAARATPTKLPPLPEFIKDLFGADKSKGGPKEGTRRTAGDAHLEAERFFYGSDRLGDTSPVGGRIERNARDVTDYRPEELAEHNAEATRLLEANRSLEEQALSQLPPEAQAQYRKVAAGLAADPQARLALQLLLVDGKLPGAPSAANGDNLLAGLAKLVEQAVYPGMDRAELLGDLVQEIAFPSAINQGPVLTCTVTAMQIKLAMENPAEYVRLVSGLASPEGKVALANGVVIERKAGIEGEESLRSMSSRLLAPALMEYGDGADYTYDPKTDLHYDKNGKAFNPGLVGPEIERAWEGLFGKPATQINVPPAKPEEAAQQVADQVASGGTVVVGLRQDAGGGHAVLVTGVRDGRVYYTNPFGYEESMPLAEFEARLYTAVLPAPTLGFSSVVSGLGLPVPEK